MMVCAWLFSLGWGNSWHKQLKGKQFSLAPELRMSLNQGEEAGLQDWLSLCQQEQKVADHMVTDKKQKGQARPRRVLSSSRAIPGYPLLVAGPHVPKASHLPTPPPARDHVLTPLALWVPLTGHKANGHVIQQKCPTLHQTLSGPGRKNDLV